MLSLAIYFGLCVLFTSIVVYSIGGIKESKIAISEQVDLICANMLENYGYEIDGNKIRNILVLFFFVASPILCAAVYLNRFSK